ncbi:NFX1-type zinc finger-containing protein 1-like [Drosophila innubila]|uniref:NFX1-type zinc finger-containing protein 1-like n=1 Tax=Drosophila innubila TaxID=198719 RepID=UPI00148BE897|nr:NFX1-type zinc finger-containing protein 1-like [Drosophila innubila]
MSDSDDDWFNKDENEMVQSLQQQVVHKVENETHEERIEFTGKADHFSRQFSLEASDSNSGASTKVRFSTGELVAALKLTPLEMFIYFMSEQRDLFVDQLSANEAQKRILQYVKVLTVLCQTELGGFDVQLLSGFARQSVLLKHVTIFAEKLFTPPSKGHLDDESELMLRSIKWLLLRAHKLGVMGDLGYELIEHFKTLLARCQLPKLLEHPLCIEFSQELAALPTVANVKNEIYPKLEELQTPESVSFANSAAPVVPGDAAGYINWHRQLLREDFAQPLREFVVRVRDETQRDTLVKKYLLWTHTQLILNPEFNDAELHSRVLMDIRPAKRIEKMELSKADMNLQCEFLKSLKTGALLCFTTSYDFDNLILATVASTDFDKMYQGYLNVEIVKQYNIGNIYGKPLIMYETPVFFEPYLRVHDYLSTCSADNFPMRRYIVDGCLDVSQPAYINSDVQLKYKLQPPKHLNELQQKAIRDAFSNEFCLIQGPPGTGKTHLSVELLNVLLQNAAALKTGPIIVLTYTNDSLDKFLLKASKHTDSIIRFGSQTRMPELAKFNVRSKVDEQLVPPRLKHLWWMVKCEYKEQFKQLQALHANFDGTEKDYNKIQKAQEDLQLVAEKRNTLRTIFHYYVVRDKALVAMTTSCGARLNYLFRLLQSKCFIFEEAAETAETHVLACLTPYTEHVILIGDHKQLKPYTGNDAHQGLQVSLFERLINNQFPVTVLNLQYRMRPCIAKLLVPTFYDKLEDDESVIAYENVKGMSANMYFVNHNNPENRQTNMSIINSHEARQLVKLALSLKYKMSDIVILTPYIAQVNYIKSLMSTKQREKLLVATVDSYQGLEANIVLLSLVRSNTKGSIGFLRLPNRVCVALSRARWGLYMIGNMETLLCGNPELWGAINGKLQAENAIGDAFPLVDAL